MFDNFRLRNVTAHIMSTLAGLLLAGVSLLLVAEGKAGYAEVSPVLLVVIPFLLYGKKKEKDGVD